MKRIEGFAFPHRSERSLLFFTLVVYKGLGCLTNDYLLLRFTMTTTTIIMISNCLYQAHIHVCLPPSPSHTPVAARQQQQRRQHYERSLPFQRRNSFESLNEFQERKFRSSNNSKNLRWGGRVAATASSPTHQPPPPRSCHVASRARSTGHTGGHDIQDTDVLFPLPLSSGYT